MLVFMTTSNDENLGLVLVPSFSLLVVCTASDKKLGGAWNEGYRHVEHFDCLQTPPAATTRLSYVHVGFLRRMKYATLYLEAISI